MEVYTGEGRVATENIPAEMKTYRSWVVWLRAGTKKLPYTPGEDRQAKTNDMRTWRGFEEAVEAYESSSRYDGIGFVLSSGDPYAGIDLDRCRDPQTGELEGWAKKIVRDLDGYAEASPSGTGVHVFVKAKAENNTREGSIEVYSSGQFLTVTGRSLR